MYCLLRLRSKSFLSPYGRIQAVMESLITRGPSQTKQIGVRPAQVRAPQLRTTRYFPLVSTRVPLEVLGPTGYPDTAMEMDDFLSRTARADDIISVTGLDADSRALLLTLTYIMRETAELERAEITRSLAWLFGGWLRLLQDGDLPRSLEEVGPDYAILD